MLSRLFKHSVGILVVVACLPVMAQAQTSGVAWRTNLDQAKLEAAQSRRLLLLHFTTKSCGPCRALDQNVFSQPHVGPAIEQDYVPVRIDADASPALAAMYRIDRVPTEIVASPDGQMLANPPIPDKADAYLAQLQNMARHFRQVASPPAQGSQPANVNSAYAALPIAPSSGLSAGQTPATGGPQVIDNRVAQQAQQSQPQSQTNPYVSAAANPGVYGQAQNVYAAPPQQAMPTQAAQQSTQQATPPQPGNSATQTIAAQAPAMPNNAMPRSYRNSSTDATTAVAAAAPAATAGIAAAGAGPIASSQAPGASIAAGAATAALAAAPKREKPELPAGSPPLAFDGYCPVTLKTLNRWSEGDRQFGAVHRGRTYLFSGAEQRDQFLVNPDGFSPVFAGLDPVMLIDKQQSVEGSRALGFRYGDSFYLFSSEETKQKFAASPHTYAAGVRQAMNRVDAGGTLRR